MFSGIVQGRLAAAVVTVIAGLSLAACGGGGSKKGGSAPAPDPNDDYIEIVDDNTGADPSLDCDSQNVEIDDLRGNRTVLGIDAFSGTGLSVRLPFVKKIRSGGRYGNVSLGADGVYVYTLDAAYAGDPDGVPAFSDTITWYDADCRLHSRPVALYADPLLEQSWHLASTGWQTSFRNSYPASRGTDINVRGVWARGYTGKGVTVAVVDSHVDDTHPDLRENFRGATIRESLNKPHGTNVAGLIAASCGNFEGGCGVAPGAGIVSREGYYESSVGLADLFIGGFGDDSSVRVANGSWGHIIPSFDGYPRLKAGLDMIAESGVLLVKSSGNGFEKYEKYSDCNDKGVSCYYALYDESVSHPASVVVGALNSAGSRASYSTPGSALFLTAPSGDFRYPALITTDENFSCKAVTDDEFVYSMIIRNLNPFDVIPCYRYTNDFAGTSGSTPLVSGIAALALSANPDLTLWQLRYVLAESARNDTVISGMSYEALRDRGLTVEQGWIVNAAGRRFSNYYGFGLPDAERATGLALLCSSDEACRIRGEEPFEFRSQTMFCQPVFADSYFASSYTCTFSGFNLDGADTGTDYEIENVVLDTGNTDFSPDEYANNLDCANISFDYNTSDDEKSFRALSLVQTEIKSPSHTFSVLKPLHAVFLGKTPGTGWRMLTNAFRGERFSGGDSFNVNIYSRCPLNTPIMKGASVSVTVFRK